MSVAIAREFFAAMAEKDMERALSYFTDDAVVESPMGPKHGKAEIGALLSMMANMPGGGGAPPEPVEENGQVLTRMTTPMGRMTIGFEFRDGKISRQTSKVG